VLLQGKAAQQIMAFARERKVSLIILSSHGRGGLSPWNISSVVQKVILQGWVPVLIVRAYASCSPDLTGQRYKRLLVPLDGSQRAECVLPLATALARSQGSDLLLGHVVAQPEASRQGPLTEEEQDLVHRLAELNREAAERYLGDLRSRLSGAEQICLVEGGSPAARLHELVEEERVDLVVLSAHGHFADNRWPYGSVALSFVAYGTTPLLIIQDIDQEQAIPSKAEIAAQEQKGH
jgi:nucleotide-binding universal stress UspA family protein